MLLVLLVLLITVAFILTAFTFLPLWAGFLVSALTIALMTVIPGWWRRRHIPRTETQYEAYDVGQDPRVAGSKVAGETGLGINQPHM